MAGRTHTANRRRLLAAIAAAGVAPAIDAQTAFPSRPVQLVVPYPPGGGTDVVARAIAERMGQALGQPVVVDFKGGAGGMVGAVFVSRAEPDGHTLILGNSSTHATNQSLYPNFPDALNDFSSVGRIGTAAIVLIVPAKSSFETIQDLLRAARARPGSLNYSSTGNGSGSHLAMEMFKKATRVSITHIPYRGAGPAMQDLIAGQVDASFQSLASALPHIRSGNVRPLAVASLRRSPQLSSVPTISETVAPGFEADTWFAIFSPPGTPLGTRRRLNEALIAAVRDPATAARLGNAGIVVEGSTPEALEALVRSEIAKWKRVILDSGARID